MNRAVSFAAQERRHDPDPVAQRHQARDDERDVRQPGTDARIDGVGAALQLAADQPRDEQKARKATMIVASCQAISVRAKLR